jgi:hypothetical protein
MSAPQLTAYVQGQGSVSADQLDTFEQTCDTVAELRGLTGVPGLQVFVRGYNTPGDGGQGPFYWNPTSTAADNNGASVIQPTGSLGAGRWIRLGGSLQVGPYDAAAFGILPNGMDMEDLTQAAVNAISAAGGGMLLFQAGTYMYASTVNSPPNVLWAGQGIDITTLKVSGDGYQLIGQSGLSQQGYGGLRDLTVWGYADRNTTQGSFALVNMGPFNNGEFTRVHAIYSRAFSLQATGQNWVADRCVVEFGLRDGISLSGVIDAKVTDNILNSNGDDAISVHVGTGVTGVVDKRIVITGNTVEKSTGIKCLGARNLVVANNNLRFVYGYGIYTGLDSFFLEGLDQLFSISIHDNNITDLLNLSVIIPGGNGVAAIYVDSEQVTVPGTTAPGTGNPVYPGQFDTTSGKFIVPDPYINNAGATNPRGANFGISIHHNNIVQTLSGLAHFADAGYGDLWWTAGAINPAFTSDIGLLGGAAAQGIMFEGIDNIGGMAGVSIDNNFIYGVENAVYLFNLLTITDTKVNNNIIKRCLNGVVVAPPSKINVDLEIAANSIDIDPFCEASGSFGRTSPINGTWAADGGSNYFGISAANVEGARIWSNTFSNCLETIHNAIGIDVVFPFNNYYLFDPTASPQTGIGFTNFLLNNYSITVNSNPASANYGVYAVPPITPQPDLVTESYGIPLQVLNPSGGNLTIPSANEGMYRVAPATGSTVTVTSVVFPGSFGNRSVLLLGTHGNTVTFEADVGNIRTPSGGNVTLTNETQLIEFISDGTSALTREYQANG